MTGHFTTLDGCERWAQLVGPATPLYRVPFSYPAPYSATLTVRSTTYDFRTYMLESVEPSRGLAHYVEVR